MTIPSESVELVENAWYTTDEIAAVLKVDPSSLRRWRTATPPQGPPFFHLAGRVTRYLGADIIEYLRISRVDPRAA
ncbi:helix-turn-helix domain-containing protein [Nocardia sp. NPDC057272]|uniref:helix-turn-helix domain-containing protein n=1 Tax=Nocardia sp. NPDC057272 TaxID=3346079 RepID=UPI003633AFA5